MRILLFQDSYAKFQHSDSLIQVHSKIGQHGTFCKTNLSHVPCVLFHDTILYIIHTIFHYIVLTLNIITISNICAIEHKPQTFAKILEPSGTST